MAERIKVVLRVRPFNSRESQEENGCVPAFTLHKPGTVNLCSRNGDDGGGADFFSPQKDAKGAANRLASGAQQDIGRSSFGYDHVFASDPSGPCFATQETMFDCVGMPLVENALNAYNGCAFFYGQTGAGKSHSCLGNPKSEDQKGILPRSCERLFQALQEVKDSTPGEVKYNVLVSYLEIYNEKLSDLLVREKSQIKDLQVRLHPQLGPHVPGLSQLPVLSYDAMDDILEEGAKQRIVAATNMNATSSRSHAIFSVDIRMNQNGVDSQAHIHFVDLAGSERQKKTGAEGDRLKEGIAINQSLSVLGKVISALSSGKKGGPAPFRESKLTLLLKEALSGNSRTVLIACVSPSMYNQEESVSTLEFASRCKMIATSAAKNEVDRRDQIEALEAEKKMMEDMLKKEQEAKSMLLSHVEEEKARSAALELEMAEMEKNLAARHRAEAESQMKSLKEQHMDEQAKLEAAKTRLEEAQGEDQRRAQEALEKLQREAEEKEAFRQEREAALEAHAKACREQEQIANERETALRELTDERAKLAEAEKAAEAKSREIESTLEKEKQEKESLRQEREKALDEVKRAEEMRAALVAEREEEQRKLEAEKEEKGKIGEKLEKEIAEKEQLRRERENALEESIRAAQEKEKLVAERTAVLRELEGERAKQKEREEAEARDRREWAQRLEDLEVERNQKEEEQREREEVLQRLREEQSEKDAELSRRMAEAELAKAELMGSKEELEKAQRERLEREEELKREKAEKAKAEEEMQSKLEELRQKKEDSDLQHKQEFEEAMTAKKREMDAKEEEMKTRLADLQAMLDQKATNYDELQRQAQEDNERRAKRRGISAKDCPKIANLHRDPFLNKKVVFPLGGEKGEDGAEGDAEEMVVGADAECQIHLTGLGIRDQMCAFRTEMRQGAEHPSVSIKPYSNSKVKVIGKKIEDSLGLEFVELEDGDKIAITEQHIFELEIPSIRKLKKRQSIVQDEQAFEEALRELEEGAEIDDKWKKGIEGASILIRHNSEHSGDKDAKEFLDKAKKAGKEVQRANEMLHDTPQDRRNGICMYDLSVLLDPSGRTPQLSVMAMTQRAPVSQPARGDNMCRTFSSATEGGQDAEGGEDAAIVEEECAHVWTFADFEQNRLPLIEEAYEDFKVGETQEDWQSFVWGGDTLNSYFDKVEECEKKQERIEDLQKKRLELEAQIKAKDQSNSNEAASAGGGFWRLFGLEGSSSSKPQAAASGSCSTSPRGGGSEQAQGGWGIVTRWLGMGSSAKEAPDNVITIRVKKLIKGGCGLKIKECYVQGHEYPEAAEAGWKIGDKILRINGKDVKDQRDLGRIFMEEKERLPIEFQVSRDSDKGALPSPTPSPSSSSASAPEPESKKRPTRMPSASRIINGGKDHGAKNGPLARQQARSQQPRRISTATSSASTAASSANPGPAKSARRPSESVGQQGEKQLAPQFAPLPRSNGGPAPARSHASPGSRGGSPGARPSTSAYKPAVSATTRKSMYQKVNDGSADPIAEITVAGTPDEGDFLAGTNRAVRSSIVTASRAISGLTE